MKQSKITAIQNNGTYNSKFGLMYQYEITLENGDSGDYSSKNYTAIDELPFAIGEEIYYEFEMYQGKYPKIKKPSKNPPQEGQSFPPSGGGFKSKGGNGAFALSYAKDLGIAMIGQGQKIGSAEIMAVADAFKKWLDDNG